MARSRSRSSSAAFDLGAASHCFRLASAPCRVRSLSLSLSRSVSRAAANAPTLEWFLECAPLPSSHTRSLECALDEDGELVALVGYGAFGESSRASFEHCRVVRGLRAATALRRYALASAPRNEVVMLGGAANVLRIVAPQVWLYVVVVAVAVTAAIEGLGTEKIDANESL